MRYDMHVVAFGISQRVAVESCYVISHSSLTGPFERTHPVPSFEPLTLGLGAPAPVVQESLGLGGHGCLQPYRTKRGLIYVP